MSPLSPTVPSLISSLTTDHKAPPTATELSVISPKVAQSKTILLNHSDRRYFDVVTVDATDDVEAPNDVKQAAVSDISSPKTGFVVSHMGLRSIEDELRLNSDECTKKSSGNIRSEKEKYRLELITNNVDLNSGNSNTKYNDKLEGPVQHSNSNLNKEDIKHSIKKSKRQHSAKKVKIKDEKKVSRGELDVIFERN